MRVCPYLYSYRALAAVLIIHFVYVMKFCKRNFVWSKPRTHKKGFSYRFQLWNEKYEIHICDKKFNFRLLFKPYFLCIVFFFFSNFRRYGSNDNQNLQLCSSEVKYTRPKKAKLLNGNWKYVVNTEQYTQTVRIETCL